MEWVNQQLVDAGKDVTGMHAVSGGAQAGTASMEKCVCLAEPNRLFIDLPSQGWWPCAGVFGLMFFLHSSFFSLPLLLFHPLPFPSDFFFLRQVQTM